MALHNTLKVKTLADSMQYVRVLLADDHALVRAGIAYALHEHFSATIVGEVGDGSALLASLATCYADLLITDLTMPNFQAPEMLPQIRARFPRMKVLAVTTHDAKVDILSLLYKKYIDGYYMKEQDLADLQVIVRRLLAGERGVGDPHAAQLIFSNTAPAPDLSTRQRDLLSCLHEGLDNQAIARRFGLSVKTIETYLTQLYRRLGVHSRLEAVSYFKPSPNVPDAQEQAAADANAAMADSQPTILIVDDNPRYCAKIRRIAAGCCPAALIDEAYHGQQAIQAARSASPRLALVNMELGDESGIECARRIKAQSPATRIVMLSTAAGQLSRHSLRDAGAVAVLDKQDLTAATLHAVIYDLTG